MTHTVDEGVDLVVAERRAVLVRAELGSKAQIGAGHAHGLEDDIHRGLSARTRRADVDALASEIGKFLDAGIGAGHEGERLGMEREHGAHVAPRTGVGEVLLTFDGVVHDVRLGDAEIKLALLDSVQIVDGSCGGFDRTAEAVLVACLVHQAADGAARGIVDAGDAARSDGDELLLCLCSSRAGEECCSGQGE